MTDTPYSRIPMEYRLDTERSVLAALAEDIATGDITTEWTVPEGQTSSAEIIAKANGVLAGLLVAEAVFQVLDPNLRFVSNLIDGQAISKGDEIATISGAAGSLLSGERTALNFLQRMSGIATQTARLAALIRHTSCKLLDTRKTAPGLRSLDKWAVALGGGQNHRSGLFDMVLIKENHIQLAGGLDQAVDRVLQARPTGMKVEVEVRNLTELEAALNHPIDRILLDNMSLKDMRQACQMAAGRIPLEASGNVNESSITAIAETGIDFISVGGLTHSVQALDISLLIQT